MNLRDKAADRTEWQCLVEKLGETTGEVDDSDESTTDAEDYNETALEWIQEWRDKM